MSFPPWIEGLKEILEFLEAGGVGMENKNLETQGRNFLGRENQIFLNQARRELMISTPK